MSVSKTIQIVVSEEKIGRKKLLVKVSLNGNEWLSPSGWEDKETSTLLPYEEDGNSLKIFFNKEITSTLTTNDELHFTSFESDIEHDIVWDSSAFVMEEEPEDPSKSFNLIGKLKSISKSDTVSEVPQSNAERRVADAERATEDYKAKMAAAAAAQEKAKRMAEEAARQAEEAIRMEAERAAEMERAAKAFEEAERLKAEELRRIEEARRLEEERRAEEARRLEEARQRELAAKREADRKAALKRFKTALGVTKSETDNLEKRLSALQSKAKRISEEQQHKLAQIDRIKEKLSSTQETVNTQLTEFEKKQATLDRLASEQAVLKQKNDSLKTDRHTLAQELSQSEADYAQALKDVEEAVARAEAKRINLDAKRRKDTEMLDLISQTSEKLGDQSRLVSDSSIEVQSLKSKLETYQARLTQTKMENEALEAEKQAIRETAQTTEYDVEITQSSIEALETTKKNYKKAITHLQAGGTAEEAEIMLSKSDAQMTDVSSGFASTSLSTSDAPSNVTAMPLKNTSPFKVKLPSQKAKIKTKLMTDISASYSRVKSNRSGLMSLAALVGGAAILGGTYALYNSMNTKTLIVKDSVSSPTDVAGVVTEIDPATINLDAFMEAVDTETVDTEANEDLTISTTANDPDDAPIVENAELDSNLPVEDINTEEEVITTEELEPKPEKKTLKIDTSLADAEIIKTASLNFEIPESFVRRTAESEIEDSGTDEDVGTDIGEITKNEASDENIELETPKSVTSKKEVTKRVDSAEKNKAAKTKENARIQRSETVSAAITPSEITEKVQQQLASLNFYTGSIDGLKGKATSKAIEDFKVVYGLESNPLVTTPFLEALSTAIEAREAALKLVERAPISTNETTISAPVLNTVEFSPTTTIADSAPLTETVLTPVIETASESLPAQIENAPERPQAEPVQIASAPVIVPEVETNIVPAPTQAPASVADPAQIIVEAQLRNKFVPFYPRKAERVDYYVNATVIVSYDIGVDGKPKNILVDETDYSGRFAEEFEKAAISTIRRARYTPKTVDGIPVEVTGMKKKIAFRGE